MLRSQGRTEGNALRDIRVQWESLNDFEEHIRHHFIREDETYDEDILRLIANMLYSADGQYRDFFQDEEEEEDDDDDEDLDEENESDEADKN